MFWKLYNRAWELGFDAGVLAINAAVTVMRWMDHRWPTEQNVRITVAGEPVHGRTYMDAA